VIIISYNSPANAKEITGVDVTQAQLNIAQAYIHSYSHYRWEDTAVVLRFSTDYGFPGRIFLNMPITDFSYLYSIDEDADTETTLTRFTDYDYDKRTGLLFYSDSYMSNFRLTPLLNDFEVSYTYGFDNTNIGYQKVLFAEAQIALLIKSNPMLMNEVNLSGDKATFGDAPIQKILKNVPRRIRIQGIGGVGPEALNNVRYYQNNGWVNI